MVYGIVALAFILGCLCGYYVATQDARSTQRHQSAHLALLQREVDRLMGMRT